MAVLPPSGSRPARHVRSSSASAARDVERYLADVQNAQITRFDTDPFSVSYRRRDGTAKPAPPASEDFWRIQASGAGTQTISWPVEEGK